MWFVTLLVACNQNTSKAPPVPTPVANAPQPEPAPAEPAPAADDGISKDTDISEMSEEEQHTFLMKLGEKVYTAGDGGIACITCHMANGEGMPSAFPPLVGQKEFMGDCVNHAGFIVNGLSGEIEINGVKYAGLMVAQGEMLNDLQIAAVVSYTRQSWGNDYGYCQPADVAAARAK